MTLQNAISTLYMSLATVGLVWAGLRTIHQRHLNATLRAIEERSKQLTPNGGSSVADKVSKTYALVQSQEQALSAHSDAIHLLSGRLDDHMAQHHNEPGGNEVTHHG